MTQSEKVLDYINRNGSIDPLRAFTDLGILRLGARIFDLRADGHPIETVIRTKNTQTGKKVWAEYKMKSRSPVGRPENGKGDGEVASDSTSENITKL